MVEGPADGAGFEAVATMGVWYARSVLNGRVLLNDSDCLIVRPAMQRWEDWARMVDAYGGPRVSSDRIRDLDGHGGWSAPGISSAPYRHPNHVALARRRLACQHKAHTGLPR